MALRLCVRPAFLLTLLLPASLAACTSGPPSRKGKPIVLIGESVAHKPPDTAQSAASEDVQEKTPKPPEKKGGVFTMLQMKGGAIMKRCNILFCLIICVGVLLAPMLSYAVEVSSKISDREIIESLVRLEEGIKANAEGIKTNREMIVSLRNEILGFMKWGFGLLFTGMLILMGFILWDRRSTLTPVKDDLDKLERRKVDRIIRAMKKLSEDDSRIAQVLRSVGLL